MITVDSVMISVGSGSHESKNSSWHACSSNLFVCK